MNKMTNHQDATRIRELEALNEYGLGDRHAFESAYRANLPFWGSADCIPDKTLLENFVSYYESCKARAPTNQGEE